MHGFVSVVTDQYICTFLNFIFKELLQTPINKKEQRINLMSEGGNGSLFTAGIQPTILTFPTPVIFLRQYVPSWMPQHMSPLRSGMLNVLELYLSFVRFICFFAARLSSRK